MYILVAASLQTMLPYLGRETLCHVRIDFLTDLCRHVLLYGFEKPPIPVIMELLYITNRVSVASLCIRETLLCSGSCGTRCLQQRAFV